MDSEAPATTPISEKPPGSKSLIGAVVGAAVLLAVGVATLVGSGGNWGRIHACATCSQAGQPLAKGWVEVPAGDAWALDLAAGMAVVVRGPARFEIAGPRPGHWALALSRGVLFTQVATQAHAIVLLQRSANPEVDGVTVSNG